MALRLVRCVPIDVYVATFTEDSFFPWLKATLEANADLKDSVVDFIEKKVYQIGVRGCKDGAYDAKTVQREWESLANGVAEYCAKAILTFRDTVFESAIATLIAPNWLLEKFPPDSDKFKWLLDNFIGVVLDARTNDGTYGIQISQPDNVLIPDDTSHMTLLSVLFMRGSGSLLSTA